MIITILSHCLSIILALVLCLPFISYAEDPPSLPCMTNGSFDGLRCGIDLDGNGLVDNCDELKICYRPDGGQCTGDVTAGYTCARTSLKYSTAEQCQAMCGGSRDFMCPTDATDDVCNGNAPFTKRTYMEVTPGDPQTSTYTFALTKSPVTRTDLYAVSAQYGGHAASKAYKDHILQNYGSGPLFIEGGTLYSDGFFGSPDAYPCAYYESYNGSIWRPRNYCPGNSCSSYNVSPSGGAQSWERVDRTCSATSFCQDIYLGTCLPDTIRQDIYLQEASSQTYLTTRTYYTGPNSGSFWYNNATEANINNVWYGVELRCVASTTIDGYNVCTSFYHRIYSSSMSLTGTLGSNGQCDQSISHWAGPAQTVGSVYVHDTFTGSYSPPVLKGTLCHTPGSNPAVYNNTQTVAGQTVNTRCSSSSTVTSCDGTASSVCNTYTQTVCGMSYPFSFGNTCSAQTVSGLACGGQGSTTITVTASSSIDRPVEYRDIPGLISGVTQWDSVKCNPCQNSSTGVVTDDPDPPTGPVIDETKICTNFKMFGGAAKRCRPSSIMTLGTNCCDLKGWFKSWCKVEERELKKRRQAGSCAEIGTYCSKKLKFLGLCLERKRTYCCFNSRLSRIINEQGRPQIAKGFGTPKNPDCKGFTPEEFAQLDFSSIDLSEYIETIAPPDTSGAQNQILQGVQDWLIDQQNPSPGNRDQ